MKDKTLKKRTLEATSLDLVYTTLPVAYRFRTYPLLYKMTTLPILRRDQGLLSAGWNV
ncbi:hypothetical protein ES705_04975 [subsurface metagenome]